MDTIDLNRFFVEHQNIDKPIEKAILYKKLIENKDFFEAYKKSFSDTEIFKILNEEDFLKNFKLEIHLLVYHSLETLFSLIFAYIETPEKIWEHLTKYKPYQFNQKLQIIIDKGFGAIGNREDLQLVSDVFFSSTQKDFLKKEDVILNMNSILNFIKLASKRMLNRKDEYNSYKHGMRLLSGNGKVDFIKKEVVMKLFELPVIFFLKMKKLYLDQLNMKKILK